MTQQTAPVSTETQSGKLDPHVNRVLWMLVFAVFVVFFTEMAMTVAIPRIIEDFRISANIGQWLTTGYALTMAVVIPMTGWILQRLTTRTVYVLAMSLFLAGTILGSVAPTFEVLLLARIIQASGTAIMFPLLMTTIFQVVPMAFRGRVMGRNSIVMSLAPAAGPAISGIILTFLHWRFLFILIVPIAILLLIFGTRVPDVGERRDVPLDFPSLGLSAIAFSTLVYGLSSIGLAAEGGVLVQPWIPILTGVVFLGLFIWRQILLQRTDAALLDLRTVLYRGYTVSLIILGIAMFTLFGGSLLIPFFILNVLDLDPYVVGVAIVPGSLAMAFGGPVIGRLVDRIGARPIAIPATIIVSISIWLLATVLHEDTSIWVITAIQTLLSLGLVGIFTPLFTAGLSSLEPRLLSHGSAIFGTAQQVFGAAGIAVFIATFTLVGANEIAAGSMEDVATAAGIRAAYLIGAVASFGMVALAFFVPKLKPAQASDPAMAMH
jgi:DHA2 family lincomycin resistance protein-like MFS transporter